MIVSHHKWCEAPLLSLCVSMSHILRPNLEKLDLNFSVRFIYLVFFHRPIGTFKWTLIHETFCLISSDFTISYRLQDSFSSFNNSGDYTLLMFHID